MPNENKRLDGRVWTGSFLLIAGGLLLASKLGYPIPKWLLSWEMFLIVLGLFIGIKHNFKNPSWIILIFIGTASLIDDVYPIYNFRNYIWPVAIMILGAFFLLKPKRKVSEEGIKGRFTEITGNRIPNMDDVIDATAIFGGVQRKVLSKNFLGGEITAVMGGAEIDLTQADITGTAVLDISAVFGGVKLIVPPDWNVQNQATAIFGGVDDKRTTSGVINSGKMLIIDGATVFGGIEIRSYASRSFIN